MISSTESRRRNHRQLVYTPQHLAVGAEGFCVLAVLIVVCVAAGLLL